ncbi:MAG TPA: sigma factor-like helix-turn-helix DNA-binding protein [Terriglobales bacterium]|nr:sigma factor-like helix-turn-helix DNA-binding protein [Terriglobales bacterium]
MNAVEALPMARTWQRVQLSRKLGGRKRRTESAGSPDPGLWIYRQRTAALLHRYFRLSLEVGRLPSVLGREFFRSRFSQRRRVMFEDAVIFVHDMECCLEKLDAFSQEVLVWVLLQGYSQEEASRVLGCARRTISRHVPEALDRLSAILIEQRLL